jgi:hypothetical protein
VCTDDVDQGDDLSQSEPKISDKIVGNVQKVSLNYFHRAVLDTQVRKASRKDYTKPTAARERGDAQDGWHQYMIADVQDLGTNVLNSGVRV